MLSSLTPPSTDTRPAEALLHELLVHKVELELQIDELQKAQSAMEEARNRYEDLYDFAPVGYITLSPENRLSEINLTGASLLGFNRNIMINQHFSTHVAPRDRERWSNLFMSMMKSDDNEKKTITLEITRADASTFSARLDCQRREARDMLPTLRLALIDIDGLKASEERST
ncbi:PAS domain S-box protein [Chitinimonas naiadis]